MCRKVPDGAIVTKFGTAVNVSYVMTYANFGCDRLINVHSGAVQNLLFSYYFTGWPYNRQALTRCRDTLGIYELGARSLARYDCINENYDRIYRIYLYMA